MTDMLVQDFERDPTASAGVNQWIHRPTGTVYALPVGMTIQEFLATPEPSQEPIVSSRVVSSMALRLALHRMGKLSDVEAIVGGDPELSIMWEYATHINSQNPLVAQVAQQAGVALEECFSMAEAIEKNLGG